MEAFQQPLFDRFELRIGELPVESELKELSGEGIQPELEPITQRFELEVREHFQVPAVSNEDVNTLDTLPPYSPESLQVAPNQCGYLKPLQDFDGEQNSQRFRRLPLLNSQVSSVSLSTSQSPESSWGKFSDISPWSDIDDASPDRVHETVAGKFDFGNSVTVSPISLDISLASVRTNFEAISEYDLIQYGGANNWSQTPTPVSPLSCSEIQEGLSTYSTCTCKINRLDCLRCIGRNSLTQVTSVSKLSH